MSESEDRLAALLDIVCPESKDVVMMSTPCPGPGPTKRFLNKLKEILADAEHAAYFIQGIGDGTVLKTVLDNTDKQVRIIVIEHDYGRICQVMQDIADGFERNLKRVRIIDPGPIVHQVSRLALLNGVSGQPMYFIPCYYLCEGEEGKAELEFWSHISKTVISPFLANNRTGVATQFMNARKTCQNMLDNVEHYVGSIRLDTLLTRYTGSQCVVVSAGPSVQRALPLLKKIHDEKSAVIISCLTMLKPLLNAGIRPLIVTALDYHPISAKFFEDLGDLGDIYFVLEPKVNVQVTKEALLRNARLLYNFNFWMNLFFADPNGLLISGKDAPNYQIFEGCTVAHLSLAVAMSMNAKRTLLLGQDFAFPENKYYPDQVYEAHKFKSNSLGCGGMYHAMQNWRGEQVFTDDQMVSYWFRMLEQVEACITPIDVVSDGLPFKDTGKARHIELDEAEMLYTGLPKLLPDMQLIRRNYSLSKLNDQLNQHADNIIEFAGVLDGALSIYDGDFSDPATLEAATEKAMALEETIKEKYAVQRMLVVGYSGTIPCVSAQLDKNLGKISGKKDRFHKRMDRDRMIIRQTVSRAKELADMIRAATTPF